MVVLRASVELLRRVPLFGSLNEEQLERVIASPENGLVEFGPLETIISENEVADCMYIILDGTCDVRIKAVGGREITIATLKAGEFFGEQALLPGATGRRNASVRALQPCRLFRITKNDVLLGTAQPSEEMHGAADTPAPSEDERVRMLLRTVNLFRSLAPRDLERVGDWTEIARHDAGDIIVREAEQGDFMYVVLEGAVEVFVMDDDGKIVVLARLTRGHYFGEQALLPRSSGKRNANVRADGAVTLVRVAKRYFQLIVNHDDKLMLALTAVGEAQRKKIMSVLGQEPR